MLKKYFFCAIYIFVYIEKYQNNLGLIEEEEEIHEDDPKIHKQEQKWFGGWNRRWWSEREKEKSRKVDRQKQ